MKTITLTPDASGMVDWPTLSNDKKSVVTIGSFDGMHQGHQAVIRRVVELAKKEQSFSVVVLFDPRPALVHGYAAKNGGQEPPVDMVDTQALTSMQERLRAINKLGVDYTLVVHYTLAFAAKSYRFFLGQMVGKLGMRTLALGSDAAMGANRAGDVKAIENLALATGTGRHQLHLIRVRTQAIFQNAVDFNEFALVMRCDDNSHVPIPFVAVRCFVDVGLPDVPRLA